MNTWYLVHRHLRFYLGHSDLLSLITGHITIWKMEMLYLITYLIYGYIVRTIIHWNPALGMSAMSLTHISRSKSETDLISLVARFVVMRSSRLFLPDDTSMCKRFISHKDQVSLTLFKVTSDFDLLY